jgi:hypothetical protein
MKIDNIKEEVPVIWKTSEKRMKQKYKTKRSSRLEQAEDRTSELKDESN